MQRTPGGWRTTPTNDLVTERGRRVAERLQRREAFQHAAKEIRRTGLSPEGFGGSRKKLFNCKISNFPTSVVALVLCERQNKYYKPLPKATEIQRHSLPWSQNYLIVNKMFGRIIVAPTIPQKTWRTTIQNTH